MEVFPAHLDRKFVKIIKIITVFGFPILGPILGPIVGPIVGPICAAALSMPPRATMLYRHLKEMQQYQCPKGYHAL